MRKRNCELGGNYFNDAIRRNLLRHPTIIFHLKSSRGGKQRLMLKGQVGDLSKKEVKYLCSGCREKQLKSDLDFLVQLGT